MVKTLAFVVVDFQSYDKCSCKVFFFSGCEIADEKQTIPVGVNTLYYVNAFFCRN